MRRRRAGLKDYLLGACGVVILFLGAFAVKVADDYIKPDSNIVPEFVEVTVDTIPSEKETAADNEPKYILLTEETADDSTEAETTEAATTEAATTEAATTEAATTEAETTEAATTEAETTEAETTEAETTEAATTEAETTEAETTEAETTEAETTEVITTEAETTEPTAPAIEYVLNTNTHKFHMPSCSSVSDIKDKNRAYSTDRDRIIADGYAPCKRCNP